jgi:hypothetical protein
MYGAFVYASTPYAADHAPILADAPEHYPLFAKELITLWQLDTTMMPGGQWFFFCSATDFDHEIYYGGKRYQPIPMDATGFELTTRGTLPTPNLSISNIVGAGNMLVDSYNDLVGATLIRILTLRRFLDDGATPDGNARISRDSFVVAQKTSHNALQHGVTRLWNQPRAWEWWGRSQRKDMYTENFAAAGFHRIDPADAYRAGDVLLFNFHYPVPMHGGLVMRDPNLIMHHPSGVKAADPTRLSKLEPGNRLRRFVTVALRHEDLPDVA